MCIATPGPGRWISELPGEMDLSFLTLADDGKGISSDVRSRMDRAAAPGIGLAGMKER